jgi:tRNA pseudouridine38-40 synthase
MRNLKLTIRYDGTDFSGWQTQPGRRTVQETVEAAIREITREARVQLNCSGRTDSGVHAVAQVANVYTASKLPCGVLLKAINAKLPADVCVRAVEEAPQSFCANKDALRKAYRYVIRDGRLPDPFLRRYAWFVRQPLDAAAMARAGRCLVGRHDFRCFETEWPNRLTSVRTITHLAVNRFGETIWIDVEADGFLYNMVRAIAGTLVQVGRGFWPEGRVEEVLKAMDRRLAGPTAPPEGLFLLRVTYPDPGERPACAGRGSATVTATTTSRLTPAAHPTEPCPTSPTRPNSKSSRWRARRRRRSRSPAAKVSLTGPWCWRPWAACGTTLP